MTVWIQKTIVLATAIFCLAALPALAKDVIPNVVTVSLLRQNTPGGEAYLRLSTPTAVNGCGHVGPLETTVDTEPPYLTVTLKNYTIDTDALKDKNHPACDGRMQFAAADIPLDRKMLQDRHITTVHFLLEDGRADDYYTLTLDDNSLAVLPRGKVQVFKPGLRSVGGQAALQLWIYPAQTIVLTAPAAQRGGIVANFARQAGLTPLETLLPDFVMPPGQPDRHYYVDQGARLAAQITSADDMPLSDMVYARRPKAQE